MPGGGRLGFALPGVAIVAHHRWRDGRAAQARLTLDGLHLDLRAAAPPWRVDLAWRGWIASCPTYDGAAIEAVPLAEAAALPTCDEHGLAEVVA